ncbi:MAG: permease [Microbacteriaceae bacterium]|nr:permease [Microbacteriaceae bacterium]
MTKTAVKARQRAVRGVLVLLCALLAVRLVSLFLPADLVPAIVRDGGTLAVGVFVESFPFVVLGALVSAAVQLWVPQRVMFRLLPQRPALRRAVLSLLGVVLPVCECGNVPLARGLLRQGLSPAEALTFVLAAPILNPVTIITTYQAFGFDNGILAARIIGGFVIANLVGWVFSRQRDESALLQPDFAASCAHSGEEERSGWLSRGSVLFAQDLLLLMPALALGSVLAAVIQVGAPPQVLTGLGEHPVWSVFALILLAAAVSICSTVDAFFMLGFAAVFLPGGIVAFLVFGAMIDIKMLLLLRSTFRAKTLAAVTALVFLGALCLGYGVNLLV